MKKINIAELLKDCPKGMELDCTMFEDVKFIDIDEGDKPICIRTGDIYRYLTKFGTWNFDDNAKCIIFPKGRTTWEEFVPPCKFKNGDIISNGDYVAIFYKIGTPCGCISNSVVYYHCYYTQKYCIFKKELDFGIGIFTEFKYATEEERQKLFNAIKANGYEWNSETKTLKKLVVPKFKVGDRIVKKNSVCVPILITNVSDEFYYSNTGSSVGVLSISEQDEYTLLPLLPNKFDINTLKPFDKVLVRDCNSHVWNIQFFEKYKSGKFPFICMGYNKYKECIPYEGNEHLLDTAGDCNDYYKNWK